MFSQEKLLTGNIATLVTMNIPKQVQSQHLRVTINFFFLLSEWLCQLQNGIETKIVLDQPESISIPIKNQTVLARSGSVQKAIQYLFGLYAAFQGHLTLIQIKRKQIISQDWCKIFIAEEKYKVKRNVLIRFSKVNEVIVMPSFKRTATIK